MSVKAIIILALLQLGSVLGCSDSQCQTLLVDVGSLKEGMEVLKETIQLLLAQNQHIATELVSMKQETAAKLTKATTELASMKQETAAELASMKQETAAKLAETTTELASIKQELMTIKQEARETFKQIDINYTKNGSQCRPQTLQQLQTIESNTQTVLETLEVLSRRNTSGYLMSTQQCPPRWPIDNTTVSVPIQNIAQTCNDIARRNPNSPQGYYQLRNVDGTTTIVRCPEQHGNPCPEIAQFPSSPSGYYEVRNSTGQLVRVYCDMNRTFTKTGALRGWMSVVNLNMNDSNQNCPNGLAALGNPTSCGKSSRDSCDSAIFPVHGVWYRRVCGKMIGYQRGESRAFWDYTRDRTSRTRTPPDSDYVDGATLTHGRPNNRTHIWTFVVSNTEANYYDRQYKCPCANTNIHINVYVPPFIGGDYFCDTGAQAGVSRVTYLEDPLWDGRGCGPTSSCCTLNSPPYFCKDLPQPTTDDIELRLCKYGGTTHGDIMIEQIELYVS